MKKLAVILIVVLLGVFLTSCGTTPDDYDEFITCISKLNTPQKIGDYMLGNFTYKIHDSWALDPYDLWKIKEGDCDDFSAFGIFAADYHGYDTYQIKIWDNTFYQHFVAVYDEGIWYSITDNRYYYWGFDDFREIVDYVCDIREKVWRKYIVYDYWNKIVEEVEQ